MKTKYTPGPWKAVGTTVSQATSYGSGNRIVAECGQSTSPLDYGNARLIAAAPEMKSALEHFVSTTNGLMKTHPSLREEFDLILAWGEAALAKAEGK